MPFQMLLSFKILSAICTENHFDEYIRDEDGMPKSSESVRPFQSPKKPCQADLGANRELSE
jgi:hypothetical protein